MARKKRGGINMMLGTSGASDQCVWGLYGCVFSRRFQWDHRRPCPTSAAGYIVDLIKSTFGGLRDLWSRSLRCLWMHLFKALQWDHRPTSATGYITAFSRRRPYRPALTSSHETVHTDPYMCGEGGWFKLAVFSRRRPSLAAVTSSESSFLCQCRPH